MELVGINRQALSQTYYIIDGMNEVNKNKVPLFLKDKIYECMDKDYKYDSEQELLLEAKELIFAILYKYILDEKQKKKTDEYFRFYDSKIEEQKIGKYEIKFKEKSASTIQSDMQITVVKIKGLINRIIDKIKAFFHRQITY